MTTKNITTYAQRKYPRYNKFETVADPTWVKVVYEGFSWYPSGNRPTVKLANGEYDKADRYNLIQVIE